MRRVTHAAHLLAVVTFIFFGAVVHAGKSTTATPTVSVSAPSPAVGTVTVSAQGTTRKLRRLEVYLDGNLKVTCSTSPCNYPWNTQFSANGTHTLHAKRYDAGGTVEASTSLAIVVNNDVTSPMVSLTAPATASGVVSLSASSSDAGGVNTTQIYIDGTLVASRIGSTASYSWNTTTTTDGIHTVEARGTDLSGNVGASALANVSVSNTTQPPSPPGGIAELPREQVDTSYVVPNGQVISVPVGGSLQAALDAAQPGDVITLAAGATYVGPFTLRNTVGTGWITVRTSTSDISLPVGSRVTPQHAPLMPRLVTSGGPILRADPGAHHYRFVGIELSPSPGVFLYNLVELGVGVTSPDALPHHIIFDRCYLHGDPGKGSRRGLALNTGEAAVIDSYLADFKEVGADSQAIGVWNGTGPFKFKNNYLEAAGENVMFGGADPSISQLVPADIEIRGNHFSKPLAWRLGDPTYAGTHWTVKNLFELKNARRVLIDGNLFEYNWADAQNGFAILFTVRNQDGTAPWSAVQDVTFTNNVVRHVAAGLNILGVDNFYPSELTQRIVVQNNLFLDVTASAWGGNGRLFQILAGPADVIIDHNTGFQTGSLIMGDGAPALGFAYTNNIAFHNAYGVMGTNHGVGNDTLATYFPGATFARNILIGGPSNLYPADNFFPATLVEVGFVDPAENDYSLSSTSPYGGMATDGTDIGALF